MRTAPLKQVVSPGPKPIGPYSPAVKAGNLIYLSGTRAEDDSGAIAGRGDVAGQTRRVIERMRDVLAASGSSLEHVVAATVYLTSAAHFQVMNEAYRAFWPRDPPTRTTVMTGLVRPDALVEIAMIAVPAGAERVVVHPAGWRASPNPYSHGIRSGDTLFLSGLVPRRGRDHAAVSGDIGVQTRAVLENAGELLSAAGMSFANVASARVYLTDASLFNGMNETYRQFFSEAPPARATVTAGLAGSEYLVEMTFTASSAPREAIGTPPPGVPLSPAVRAGQRLYVSGMLGNTPEAAGDAGAQTHETLARIGRTLEQAGALPSDVVDATVYLKEAGALAAASEAYGAFFGQEFPAWTAVAAPLVVEDGLVEIVVTAVLR